jgi:hypothetical protein
VIQEARADYGSSAAFYAYVNPNFIDVSDLYQVGESLCGSSSQTGTHVADPNWTTHGTDAVMRGYASKGPAYDAAGCALPNGDSCDFFEFRTSQPSCLVAANPSEPGWQSIVDGQRQDAEATTMDGIFWDTLGNQVRGDWDPTRTHPIGVNEAIIEAERQHFSSIRDSMATAGMTATRENAPDYLNDLVPAAWNFNDQTVLANRYVNVPLLAAVYHDRMIYGGPPAATTEPINALSTKWARFVTGGYTPGPFPLHVLDKADFINGPADGPREALVKLLADVKRTLPVYLTEGEFLGPLLYTDQNGTSDTITVDGWCEDFGCSSTKTGSAAPTVHSIQGVWWKGSDGSYALVYANANQLGPANAYVWVPPAFRGSAKQDCRYDEPSPCTPQPGFQDLGAELRLSAGSGEYRVVRLETRCPATPAAGCIRPFQPGKARLLLKDSADDSRDRTDFTWIKSDLVDPATDFGDPAAGRTVYTLCVYDQSSGGASTSLVLEAQMPPAGVCGTSPCWKRTTGGFDYRDTALANDGVLKIMLKGNSLTPGKSKVIVKGKGAELPFPAGMLPLTQDPTVTAQLISSTASCFEAQFSTNLRNDGALFKAKAD